MVRSCLLYRKNPHLQRIKQKNTIRQTRCRLYTGHSLNYRTLLTNFWTNQILPMTNFTPEDLLSYLYKETSPEQSLAIETMLEKDWTLREKLLVLKASIQRLDKLMETPRTEVVLNVLNHAKEQTLEEYH
jgi:hypothetical protein